jgi:hypothetical protein
MIASIGGLHHAYWAGQKLVGELALLVDQRGIERLGGSLQRVEAVEKLFADGTCQPVLIGMLL